MLSRNNKKNDLVVVVCATVRNPNKSFDRRLHHILQAMKAESSVASVEALIVESDSKNLQFKFTKSSRDFEVTIINLGNLRKFLPNRISRLAFCREAYREKLHIISPDLVLVADLDAGNFHKFDFGRALLDMDAYSAIFCNWRPVYFDIFALRSKGWVYMEYQTGGLRSKPFTSRVAKFFHTYQKMRSLSREHRFIEVESAFGGLAIYHYDALADSSYLLNGIPEGNVCEHVILHGAMVKKGHRMAIDTHLEITGYNKHILIRLMLVPLIGKIGSI